MRLVLSTFLATGAFTFAGETTEKHAELRGSSETTVLERDLSAVDCGLPAPTIIGDEGHEDEYRGYYAPSGCATCNLYCRWIGGSVSGGDPAIRIAFEESTFVCKSAESDHTISYHHGLGGFPTFPYTKCSAANAEAPPEVFDVPWNHVAVADSAPADDSPVVASTEGRAASPVAATTGFSIVAPTDPPVAAPIDAPVVPPTDSPVVAPTDAPVVPPTDAPVVRPTDAPVVPCLAMNEQCRNVFPDPCCGYCHKNGKCR